MVENYKDTSILCQKAKQEKTFCHAWWIISNPRKFWTQIIYINTVRDILKANMQLKPDTSVLGLMNKKLTARLLHA